MRTLWKVHNLRTQPFLLTTSHQPHVQTEPAEDPRDGKGPRREQGALHQMHQDDGKIRRVSIGFPKQKNHGHAMIFLFKGMNVRP